MPSRAAPGGGMKQRVCACLLCVRSRGWAAIKQSGTKERLLELVDEIQNELCCAEFELDCLQHLNPSEATAHNVVRREAERLVIELARLWAALGDGDFDETARLRCDGLRDAMRALEECGHSLKESPHVE